MVFRCFCWDTDTWRKMQRKQLGLLVFQQRESSALTTFGLVQIVSGLHSFLLLFWFIKLSKCLVQIQRICLQCDREKQMKAGQNERKYLELIISHQQFRETACVWKQNWLRTSAVSLLFAPFVMCNSTCQHKLSYCVCWCGAKKNIRRKTAVNAAK